MLQKKYFLFIMLCAIGYSQTIYELLPGSKNNSFELSFSNKSKLENQSVNVTVQESPEWIEFSNDEINIENVNSLQMQTAQFYFNISDIAPIGEEASIKFKISDNTNRSWLKTYNIKVTPPKVFQVNQNYPNPFNPSTTIKYSIPQDAFVIIKVFNILGEEISVLVNKEMKTGIHEAIFDASNLSSGFYFYIVEAKGMDGAKYFDTKKMILLR